MGFRHVAILLLFSVFGALYAHAQRDASQMAEIEVQDVGFQQVRDTLGEVWWEATVNLRMKARAGSEGKFAEQVRVDFNLALPRHGQAADLVFYRASTSTAALGTGSSVFRFYLPPAIVSRDQLSRDAQYWAVDISVAGTPLPPNRKQVGAGFSSSAAVENFRRKLAQETVKNDGVLLPLHLVPAGLLSGGDPPAIRTEANVPVRR